MHFPTARWALPVLALGAAATLTPSEKEFNDIGCKFKL